MRQISGKLRHHYAQTTKFGDKQNILLFFWRALVKHHLPDDFITKFSHNFTFPW